MNFVQQLKGLPFVALLKLEFKLHKKKGNSAMRNEEIVNHLTVCIVMHQKVIVEE